LALAVVLVVGVLLAPVLGTLSGAARAAVVRTLARAALTVLGVRLLVRGRPARPGSLLVANHVSWLDVLVVLAAVPAQVVAKREVRDWPGIGALGSAAGAIFMDRSRPRALPATVAEVTAVLRAGTSVAAFPEGTTYCGIERRSDCGAGRGAFRPALFQAAVDAGAPVVPLAVAYRARGRETRAAAFVGDDTLWASVRRVAAVRGLTVSLVGHPALHPADGADRRVLARAAQATVGCSTHRKLSDKVQARPSAVDDDCRHGRDTDPGQAG
jgi:1-acyl-sn-glycerol-3-phosphate acyltransferase